ncbi:MAG: hypothetical protein KGZ65_04150 [Sphingomonadales bacterium]|nr:hypothetical protein [Sphingomonadaceae bacterium]MBS3930405.1 hypothetical protein [Sphingomonadales bacterium]
MKTRFPEIGMTVRKHYKCACGRWVTRSKRFYQTINPYNVTASGFMKDQYQILAECRQEAAAWTRKKDPCTHSAHAVKEIR